MKKLLWLCALLVPATAFASTGSEGIDINWNDCNPTGVPHKNFLCTGVTNQNYVLHMQVKTKEDLPSFVGIAIFLDLQSEAPGNLKPFWHYQSLGCQRQGGAIPNGIAMSDVLPLAGDCSSLPDPWSGDGTGGFEGIAAYGVDFYGPGNGHFVLGVAHSGSFPITGGVNYWIAQLTFNNRNRNICAGCSDQAVIVANLASLESNDGHRTVNLGFADKSQNCVTINFGLQGTCQVDPTRNTSWGQLKSLYR
jgi:hypothetical protein